jgi:hypothetical protein
MSRAERLKSGTARNSGVFQTPGSAPLADNWGYVMYSLETAVGDYSEVLSLGEALGAFSVALFYSILRAEGCNPFIRDGGLYTEFGNSEMAREAGTWAALYDPTGELRLEYAREAWTARRSEAEVVWLG